MANVFVSENDDAVRLIDLEAARNLKDTNPPAMNAMGFQPPKHCTAEQADWFAVSRLIATLFDIQNNITILSPEYWSVFLKRIQEAFGEEPVSLINSLNERYPGENGIVVVPATPTESIRPYTWKLPQQQVSLHDIQLISNQTVKGIEATRHAVPGKLFPADAKLESNYAHVNIATGAAGVLLSLIRAGKTVDPADVRWTFDSLVNGISESADYGLFSGLTGMATFFYEVGKKDWAKNLIKQVSGNWKSLRNVNLEKGLSGIGLALTAFGASEEEDQYIGTAVNIADHIHQVLFDTDIEHEHKKLSHSSGLFQGWSGAALFFSSLGKVTEDPRYFSWASACKGDPPEILLVRVIDALRTVLPPKPLQRRYDILKETVDPMRPFVAHLKGVRHAIEQLNRLAVFAILLIGIALAPDSEEVHRRDFYDRGGRRWLIQFLVFLLEIKSHASLLFQQRSFPVHFLFTAHT